MSDKIITAPGGTCSVSHFHLYRQQDFNSPVETWGSIGPVVAEALLTGSQAGGEICASTLLERRFPPLKARGPIISLSGLQAGGSVTPNALHASPHLGLSRAAGPFCWGPVRDADIVKPSRFGRGQLDDLILKFAALLESSMPKTMADTSRAGQKTSRDKTRATNPCDGCALRRVRCEGGRPCKECQKRFLTCTSLRIARKRGPKGPRQSTTQKVRSLQRQLQLTDGAGHQDTESNLSEGSPASPGSCHSPCSPGVRRSSVPALVGPQPKYTPLPLEAYCKFLGIFRERLYSVWPVLSCGSLITRLVSDEHDYEAWALAASVCAGVIAQLRLPEHGQSQRTSQSSFGSTSSSTAKANAERVRIARLTETTSHHFAADAEHFRTCYAYREQPSVSSLLASFFLHIYCANSELLRTAGFHLRDSLTQTHMLGLHRLDAYFGLASEDRELRLRVYWVLFVSERTYCIQHGLPTVLRPISLRPSPKDGPDGCSGSPILSFLYLTKLFTFLDGDLIEPPSAISAVDAGTPTTGTGLMGDQFDKQSARNKVTVFQSDLGSTAEGVGLDETQRVDIFVTRNWIRILLWEYTVRHFTMSCSADDQAFSILLPALVAHEMLGLFSAVSGKSIRAHGYGMELKVFRIADSLLDVLACRRPIGQPESMLVGSRDALHSLEKVLTMVGGPESIFLNKLRQRMSEAQLPVPSSSWMQLPWMENCDKPRERENDKTSDAYLSDFDLGSNGVFELDEAACDQLTGTMMDEMPLITTPVFEFGDLQGNSGWNVSNVDLNAGNTTA